MMLKEKKTINKEHKNNMSRGKLQTKQKSIFRYIN